MNGFGARLVAAREKKGLTQKALAELLNITPTRLNYWEKDKREPDFFYFSNILKVLDIDANELLGLSETVNALNRNQVFSLSKTEQGLISDFRSLSTQGQDYILQTMDMVKDKYKKDTCVSVLEENIG